MRKQQQSNKTDSVIFLVPNTLYDTDEGYLDAIVRELVKKHGDRGVEASFHRVTGKFDRRAYNRDYIAKKRSENPDYCKKRESS